MAALHGSSADVGDLAVRTAAFLADRLRYSPLGRTATVDEMRAALDGAITADGLGVDRSWDLLIDRVLANTVGIDSERFLAFIPVSPAAAATWMDAIVGTTSVPAESWLEAAGAVAAENQVLELLASLAGMPSGAGGCFMSGGSIGNLSALAVARDQQPAKRVVAVADTAHASVHNTLHLLGMDALTVPTGSDGRFTATALRVAVAGRDDVGTIVAAAGSTNAGLIDDLDGLADVAAEIGAWFHVDGAYGAATLLLPEFADRLRGIGRADSFIVDPHKWLFAPAGSCALIYRDPSLAAAVHAQHGPYIDVFRQHGDEWNPADFGYQLTRRAAGLPLWFALVLHGTDAFATAIRRGVELAAYAADAVRSAGDHVELVMEPELSVVLFRRRGWTAGEWSAWARDLLARGVAFVAPTTWRGEPVGRLVFMHPLTPTTLIDEIVGTLA
ncbi:MAG: aspartate aminotransferase family protein [Ilumatobacteraceae bacterium]|nr:aspartate aminotransferase family protein [Ilumatobacteraceae bacterium]